MKEFEEAKDKVMMGAERRSMVMTDKEKELTAYHEAGHALVMVEIPGHDPVHKVTIIPRGRALGVTMFLPERDKYSQSKLELEALITSLFGGRMAEELIFGPENVTTGASNDIHRATSLARRMVTEWGMSEKLGRLRYSENEEEVFLGHSVTQRKNISDATAKIIDEEIRRIIDESEEKAKNILVTHMDALHRVAKALLEYETISGDEVRALMRGDDISRDSDDTPANPVNPSGPTGNAVPGRRPSGVPSSGDLNPQPGGSA